MSVFLLEIGTTTFGSALFCLVALKLVFVFLVRVILIKQLGFLFCGGWFGSVFPLGSFGLESFRLFHVFKRVLFGKCCYCHVGRGACVC